MRTHECARKPGSCAELEPSVRRLPTLRPQRQTSRRHAPPTIMEVPCDASDCTTVCPDAPTGPRTRGLRGRSVPRGHDIRIGCRRARRWSCGQLCGSARGGSRGKPAARSTDRSRWKLFLSDLGSTNGVFLRIRGPTFSLMATGCGWVTSTSSSSSSKIARRTLHRTARCTSRARVAKARFACCRPWSAARPGFRPRPSTDQLTIGGEGSTIAFTADPHLSTEHAQDLRFRERQVRDRGHGLRQWNVCPRQG